jgi:hypothetical protein
VLHGDLKLIRASRGGLELYDLAADPGEGRNLAATGGAERERLEASLAAFERQVHAERRAERRLEIPEEDARALRALGYTEADERD